MQLAQAAAIRERAAGTPADGYQASADAIAAVVTATRERGRMKRE
jgi:hypothetical protein